MQEWVEWVAYESLNTKKTSSWVISEVVAVAYESEFGLFTDSAFRFVFRFFLVFFFFFFPGYFLPLGFARRSFSTRKLQG